MAKKVEVEWLLDSEDYIRILAKCGKWQAELSRNELYSEGQVFISHMDKDQVPVFLGDEKKIDEPENAIRLIEEVSQEMVKKLRCSLPCKCKCQNVYVVSLNEGDLKNLQAQKPIKLGLHFRLLPRYQHDEYFLKRIDNYGEENDGLALMAEWRKQFLRRKRTEQRGDYPKRREYAKRIKGLLDNKSC